MKFHLLAFCPEVFKWKISHKQRPLSLNPSSVIIVNRQVTKVPIPLATVYKHFYQRNFFKGAETQFLKCKELRPTASPIFFPLKLAEELMLVYRRVT